MENNHSFDDSNIMEETISCERVFDGIILHIDHVQNRLPNGKIAAREIARHIGASAVLPMDADGNVYLVRQFRAPIDRVLLEIPAGKLDAPDEDRLEAAKRELREETGFTAGSWTHLTDTFTTPGFSSERISLYLARNLNEGSCDPDADEFLNLIRIPFRDALDMVLRGELTDAKSQIAICMAAHMI